METGSEQTCARVQAEGCNARAAATAIAQQLGALVAEVAVSQGRRPADLAGDFPELSHGAPTFETLSALIVKILSATKSGRSRQAGLEPQPAQPEVLAADQASLDLLERISCLAQFCRELDCGILSNDPLAQALTKAAVDKLTTLSANDRRLIQNFLECQPAATVETQQLEKLSQPVTGTPSQLSNNDHLPEACKLLTEDLPPSTQVSSLDPQKKIRHAFNLPSANLIRTFFCRCASSAFASVVKRLPFGNALLRQLSELLPFGATAQPTEQNVESLRAWTKSGASMSIDLSNRDGSSGALDSNTLSTNPRFLRPVEMGATSVSGDPQLVHGCMWVTGVVIPLGSDGKVVDLLSYLASQVQDVGKEKIERVVSGLFKPESVPAVESLASFGSGSTARVTLWVDSSATRLPFPPNCLLLGFSCYDRSGQLVDGAETAVGILGALIVKLPPGTQKVSYLVGAGDAAGVSRELLREIKEVLPSCPRYVPESERDWLQFAARYRLDDRALARMDAAQFLKANPEYTGDAFIAALIARAGEATQEVINALACGRCDPLAYNTVRRQRSLNLATFEIVGLVVKPGSRHFSYIGHAQAVNISHEEIGVIDFTSAICNTSRAWRLSWKTRADLLLEMSQAKTLGEAHAIGLKARKAWQDSAVMNSPGVLASAGIWERLSHPFLVPFESKVQYQLEDHALNSAFVGIVNNWYQNAGASRVLDFVTYSLALQGAVQRGLECGTLSEAYLMLRQCPVKPREYEVQSLAVLEIDPKSVNLDFDPLQFVQRTSLNALVHDQLSQKGLRDFTFWVQEFSANIEVKISAERTVFLEIVDHDERYFRENPVLPNAQAISEYLQPGVIEKLSPALLCGVGRALACSALDLPNPACLGSRFSSGSDENQLAMKLCTALLDRLAELHAQISMVDVAAFMSLVVANWSSPSPTWRQTYTHLVSRIVELSTAPGEAFFNFIARNDYHADVFYHMYDGGSRGPLLSAAEAKRAAGCLARELESTEDTFNFRRFHLACQRAGLPDEFLRELAGNIEVYLHRQLCALRDPTELRWPLAAPSAAGVEQVQPNPVSNLLARIAGWYAPGVQALRQHVYLVESGLMPASSSRIWPSAKEDGLALLESLESYGELQRCVLEDIKGRESLRLNGIGLVNLKFVPLVALPTLVKFHIAATSQEPARTARQDFNEAWQRWRGAPNELDATFQAITEPAVQKRLAEIFVRRRQRLENDQLDLLLGSLDRQIEYKSVLCAHSLLGPRLESELLNWKDHPLRLRLMREGANAEIFEALLDRVKTHLSKRLPSGVPVQAVMLVAMALRADGLEGLEESSNSEALKCPAGSSTAFKGIMRRAGELAAGPNLPSFWRAAVLVPDISTQVAEREVEMALSEAERLVSRLDLSRSRSTQEHSPFAHFINSVVPNIQAHNVGGTFYQYRAYVEGDDPRLVRERSGPSGVELLTKHYQADDAPRTSMIIDLDWLAGDEAKRSDRVREIFAELLLAERSRVRLDLVFAFRGSVKRYHHITGHNPKPRGIGERDEHECTFRSKSFRADLKIMLSNAAEIMSHERLKFGSDGYGPVNVLAGGDLDFKAGDVLLLRLSAANITETQSTLAGLRKRGIKVGLLTQGQLQSRVRA